MFKIHDALAGWYQRKRGGEIQSIGSAQYFPRTKIQTLKQLNAHNLPRQMGDPIRRQPLRSEVYGNAGQPELDFLAEEISSLARQIVEQKQETIISVEEASLALHFRKRKQQIHDALVLLERQGNAKRISVEERWVLHS